jgi:uncharacterized protein (TIGR02466 family)
VGEGPVLSPYFFMNVQRIETYATPVWIATLENLLPHKQAMIDETVRLRKEADESIKQKSNRNGWHSDLRILENPKFVPLKNTLQNLSRQILVDYGANTEDRVFSFAGWANVHDKGGYNVSHVHPGSWISGSIYLKVPEGAGRLFFEDPRQATRMEHIPLLQDRNKDPMRSRGKFYVTPKEMMVVMFPGWFEHGVEDCECDQRISVAFNITPVQIRQGQLDQLRKLENKSK